MKKVVLITGGSHGIGKSLAEKFAKEGYDIVFTYLTSKLKANMLEKELKEKYNSNVLCLKVDIAKEEDVKNLFNNVAREYKKIDVLINNAAYTCDNHYKDKTKEEFLRVLEVNVVGTFLVTKYITEIMNNGVVINISSLDSTKTYNELSMDYCASKAGMNSLAQTFSLANLNNKFISLLLPWVKTEIVEEMYQEYLNNELKRIGQERLYEPFEISDSIYNYVMDEDIKSGSVIELEMK